MSSKYLLLFETNALSLQTKEKLARLFQPHFF